MSRPAQWEYLGVDYKTLEERALAKALNFGAGYGMGPASNLIQDLPKQRRRCDRCGYWFQWPEHHEEKSRSCDYLLAMGKQADAGNIPVPPLMTKILKMAGVPLIQDVRQTHGEFKNKQGHYPPLQLGLYAPVWAVLLLRHTKLGHLTSCKRPKVQAAIRELQRVAQDVGEQQVLTAEHVLQQGGYTRACEALLRKASG